MVQAFDVKIAAPGEAAIETAMAGEVIGAWNARNAVAEKIVLVPQAQNPAPPDLLIAFFHTTDGAPVDNETRRIESEIDAHLQEGRPVLVYFSEGKVHFEDATDHEVRGLEEFKQRHAAQATVDSFGDEKEFRAKFALQLDVLVRSHPHFKKDDAVASAPISSTPPPDAKISEEARLMLFEACEDPEAYIGRFRDGAVLKLQANGKQLVDLAKPGAVETWEEAFNEVVARGFIRDAGCNGRLFQISPAGFAFLKTLGKSPVGYIAELGGM